MTTDRQRTHPSAERMQALLDGGLGATEAREVREHASSCARCRAEIEGWSKLFDELAAMDRLAPSPDFTGRVMDALPEPAPGRVPLAARIRSRLGMARPAPEVPQGHLDGGAIQELLDGALAPDRAASVEAHLDGCRACREEVETWRSLVVRLDELPRLRPSPVFAERVMAHVRVRNAVALARPSLKERIANWAALNPRARKRLAALAGAGVTPVVTVALVAYTVFSHPLVTPDNLVSFLWLKAQSTLGALASAVAGWFTDSAAAFQVYSLVEPVTRSAGAAALALALLAALTLAAIWILYRNLFAPDHVGDGYARLPI